MKRVYDWQALKFQFVAGKWLSVADFFRDQHVKNNSRSRLNARGWLEDRRKYQEEVAKKTQRKAVEDEVSIRLRQQQSAKRLQLKGLKELENSEVRNVDDARKMLVDGMREERQALGLDDKNMKKNSLTQVNVSLPKTRFDDFLESANYEQILQLLTDVKRERARRRDTTVTT